MKKLKKILLVEDDEFTRFMMKEIIVTLGVEVEIAANGDDAHALLIKSPQEFGLILMDLHMPKSSGIQATKKIRESNNNPPSGLPIIALTADVNYHDDAVVEEMGMNGFASKPVTPGQLLRIIDKFCLAA